MDTLARTHRHGHTGTDTLARTHRHGHTSKDTPARTHRHGHTGKDTPARTRFLQSPASVQSPVKAELSAKMESPSAVPSWPPFRLDPHLLQALLFLSHNCTPQIDAEDSETSTHVTALIRPRLCCSLADSLTSTTHIKDGPSGGLFSPENNTHF
ncbi:unnamed protein product [Leuciscus chuanchicus]